MSENGCIRPEIGDRLAAYEMGLLEETERVEFEEHLAACAWCLEEMYAHAPAAEAMRAEPGLHARTLDSAAAQHEAARGGGLLDRLRGFLQLRTLVPITAVVAAAVAVALLLPDKILPPTPSASGLARIEALPYQSFELRGGSDRLARTLAEGLQAYADGRYRLAAHQLDTVWKQAGGDARWAQRHQVALYLGLSLLLSDQTDASILPLEAASSSSLLPVAERGRWYLAQARLLQERPCDSADLLTSLSGSPVYGELAATQLNSVREFCDNSRNQ